MSSLVPIESVNIKTTEEESGYFYAVPGNEIEWTYVPSSSDSGFTTNVWSHFYANLGLYTDEIANNYSISYADGGYLGTSLEKLYEAYNSTGIVVGLINNETYRQSIMGRDGAIVIPTLFTGTTFSASTNLTGLTSITNYFTFYDTPELIKRNTAGVCAKTVGDTRKFESLPDAVLNTGMGQQTGRGNSGMDYESGIVFLFNDYTSMTSGSTSGFSQAHKVTNPYANGKLAAKFNGDGYHLASGMIDCISGIVTFWDPNVVQGFNFLGATGGTGTTRATFPPTTAYAVVTDYDTSVSAEVRVNASPDILKFTTNPSRKQAIAEGDTSCEEVVKVTQVCLYDTSGQVTAIGTPTSIIEKTDNYVVMNLSVKLDGGIGPVWDTAVNTSVYPS
jgi:hypothetical protein